MPPSRRDELIDAAVRVFYRHGFHATNLDKVLQEGRISRMTLYNHFKSKDELIVAALRRRDEDFRGAMLAYVDRHADDPIGRIMAVFDYHGAWFDGDDFSGCMFINVAAEYPDPKSPMRKVAAESKAEVIRYIEAQCAEAGLNDPEDLAAQLGLLLEGAIVAAYVIDPAGGNGARPARAADRAKRAARVLIDAAQGD